MTTLMQASRQWSSRPNDERFTSLLDMGAKMRSIRDRSRTVVESSRKIELLPIGDDHKGLALGMNTGSLAGTVLTPSHYSFGQLCSLASPGNSPASYFRESRVSSEIICAALEENLKFRRDVQDVGLLGTLEEDGSNTPYGELRAATGPNYGRIWNADVIDMLIDKFGDGRTGQFRVPGEFGQQVDITKANTTLFASDRDMFVFLADEERRIEVPDRRNGETGSLARGFFTWNSEVGDKTLGAAFFLFDYVCCNRIVWGATEYQEVRIRHTKGAPDKWAEEAIPVLTEFSEGSAKPVMQAIEQARQAKIEGDLNDFLAKHGFGKKFIDGMRAVHMEEEGRPIETLWDATVAATAHARTIPNQDRRVEVERAAGELLKLAA